MFKNTAQKLTVIAFADAGHATLDAGEPVPGDAAQITLKIEQDDDGTRSASDDTNPTETEDGQYRFDLLQAETNGDKLTFYPESSSPGVQVVCQGGGGNVFYTTSTPAQLAALIETYIINEGDATATLQAVADKIAADWVAADASPLAIIAALKADAQWSNLATMATNLATVDTIVDAIKAVTDQFRFTVANEVDANALTVGGSLTVDWDALAASMAAELTRLGNRGQTLSLQTDVQVVRGTTWRVPLVVPAAGWTKIEFTIRNPPDQDQADSLVHIVLHDPGDAADGLLIFNAAAAANAADGGIVDPADGTAFVAITSADVTADAEIAEYCYDAKVWNAAGEVDQDIHGRLWVEHDVTRTVDPA